MVGKVALAALPWFLPKVLDSAAATLRGKRGAPPGTGAPQAVGAAVSPALVQIEPLAPEQRAGLERALKTATPEELERFELALLRAGCPRAALLCRERANAIRLEVQRAKDFAVQQEAARTMIQTEIQKGIAAEMAKVKERGQELASDLASTSAPKPAPLRVVGTTNGASVSVPVVDEAAALLGASADGVVGAPPAVVAAVQGAVKGVG